MSSACDIEITVHLNDDTVISAQCGCDIDILIEVDTPIAIDAFDWPPVVDRLLADLGSAQTLAAEALEKTNTNLGYIAELTSVTHPIAVVTAFILYPDGSGVITATATGGIGQIAFALNFNGQHVASNETGVFPVEDEGEYTVVATDEVGSAPGSATVVADFSPEFVFYRNVTEGTTLISVASDGDQGLNAILNAFAAAVINDLGEVVYYLDKDNPNLQADGVTPAHLDGTDGSVFIIKPAFWVKVWMEGDLEYTAISLVQRPGFRLSPRYAFGKYKAYLDENGKLVSRSGVYCTTYRTLTEFRTYARNGRNHLWNVTPYHMYNDLLLLYKAVVRNLDSQSVLGYVSRASSTDWNNYNGYYPVWQTGVMNDKPTLYTGSKEVVVPSFVGGSTDLVTEVVSFMGIEDFYGHIYETLDGALVYYDANLNGSIYLAENPLNFVDSGDAGGNPPEGYGFLGGVPAAGFIVNVHTGHFSPIQTGGSSSTHYCDYHYKSTSAGWRVPRVGGVLSNGAVSGCFCSSFTNSALNRVANFGARLGLFIE